MGFLGWCRLGKSVVVGSGGALANIAVGCSEEGEGLVALRDSSSVVARLKDPLS